jgi:TPR repeat protein
MLGSAKEGVAFGLKGIYWKNKMEQPVKLSYKQLSKSELSFGKLLKKDSIYIKYEDTKLEIADLDISRINLNIIKKLMQDIHALINQDDSSDNRSQKVKEASISEMISQDNEHSYSSMLRRYIENNQHDERKEELDFLRQSLRISSARAIEIETKIRNEIYNSKINYAECPSCHVQNPAKAKFCIECGERLFNSQTPKQTTPFTQHVDTQSIPVAKKFTGIDHLIVMAENGDIDAQYKLGNMYETGDGVNSDVEKAFKWYKKAADNGQSDACFRLGMMYSDGSVPSNSMQEALLYFKRAAESGHIHGQAISAAFCFMGNLFEESQRYLSQSLRSNTVDKEEIIRLYLEWCAMYFCARDNFYLYKDAPDNVRQDIREIFEIKFTRPIIVFSSKSGMIVFSEKYIQWRKRFFRDSLLGQAVGHFVDDELAGFADPVDVSLSTVCLDYSDDALRSASIEKDMITLRDGFKINVQIKDKTTCKQVAALIQILHNAVTQ